MAGPLPSYLEVLNPEQREAVLHTGKPLLILAGAGSGKTRVITTKIAYLIREMGVDPRSILAVTFTNKAAREMAGRARLIDERAENAMLRTFHSFGAWFLRRYGSQGGLEPGFVIYDDDDSAALLSTLMEGAPRAEVRAVAHVISRAKDYFISPDDPEFDLIDFRKTLRVVYAKYEERLAQIGNVDFGDLIKKPVEILRKSPELAKRLRERFRVIMVDEYQDANVAQSELLKELYGLPGDTQPPPYLCVVGDDDQSIYRFRGAEVNNILEFPDSFAGTDIIRLEKNYRSTTPILKAAASVVDHNRGRLGKTLISMRGDGKAPVLAFLPDQDTEVEFCAELIKKGGRFSEWAVLYRTNAQSLSFETGFLRKKIPYRVVGSLKFYDREEVKDILALLSFLVNPKDEVAFRRMVNKPSRGVGPVTVDRIVDAASKSDFETDGQRGNLILAAQSLSPELSAKAKAGLGVFLKAIKTGRSALDDSVTEGTFHSGDSGPTAENPLARSSETRAAGGSNGKKPQKPGKGLRSGIGLSDCVMRLAEESGIAEHYLAEDEIAGNQRISNLQELINAATLYAATEAGLLEFLEHIELDRAMEEKSETGLDAVTLITLHNTKGLEFRRVIMTGIEQGIFPRDDKKGDDLEEERRLFYVGATRAMDELYLSSCAYRRMYGRTEPMKPSVFLEEINRDGLRIIGSAPRGFGGPRQAAMQTAKQEVTGLSSKKNFHSSDGRWALGDRIFHDDHGYGFITQILESDDGPVIKVIFENGHEKRFLSQHQSSSFMKVNED